MHVSLYSEFDMIRKTPSDTNNDFKNIPIIGGLIRSMNTCFYRFSLAVHVDSMLCVACSNRHSVYCNSIIEFQKLVFRVRSSGIAAGYFQLITIDMGAPLEFLENDCIA